MSKYTYGLLPDPEDKRDLIFSSIRPETVPLPPKVDLRHLCSPVRDQGDLGSCTAFACTALREFLAIKMTGTYHTLSPLELYYLERLLEGSIGQDAGANLRDGMRVLHNAGVCPEPDDPYNPENFTKAPSTAALKDGLRNRIGAYHSLKTLTAMRQCLAGGNAFPFGFWVSESFENDTNLAQTGVMPMPERGEQILGGHAVFCVGYITNPSFPGGGCNIVKNSWSDGWGDHGYFYMPWAFVTSENVSSAWSGTL